MMVAPERLFDALEATWPPARTWQDGPWQLRAGAGGGKRVSAASLLDDADAPDIARAETAMRAVDQTPLFVLKDGQDALDSTLEARGYALVDPTIALTAAVSDLTGEPLPRLAAFNIWEPLAIMEEIWAQGGVDAARLAVMHRAAVKTAIFARASDRPAGTAFVSLHDGIAMVHAVEVLPDCRRQGVASRIMRAAAFWAETQGADAMAVLCARENTGAQALYSALGFAPCGGYHYRALPE